MAFRVDISPAALADAEEAYIWRQQNIPERAAYRILFTITEETVVVLRILHSARDIDSEF